MVPESPDVCDGMDLQQLYTSSDVSDDEDDWHR